MSVEQQPSAISRQDPARYELATQLSSVLSQLGDTTTISEVYEILEKPPEPKLGDFAMPCFRFAKALRRAPAQIAQELQQGLTGMKTPWVERIETVGAFLNIFLHKTYLAEQLLPSELGDQVRVGGGARGPQLVHRAELARQHPDRVAHLTLDAADYGVGSNRVRLIASTPAVITALKERPVQRVSIAEALAAAGLPLPAEYLKSNTSNRDGTPCVRSTQQPAFTVTASHPLIWCTRAGATVRCLTVAESAALMGFPPDWKLPLGSRAGLRADLLEDGGLQLREQARVERDAVLEGVLMNLLCLLLLSGQLSPVGHRCLRCCQPGGPRGGG